MNDEHFASRLKKTLEEHSGYNVMVIGYSLGAGICQLVVMDMLAGEHKVHTTFHYIRGPMDGPRVYLVG